MALKQISLKEWINFNSIPVIAKQMRASESCVRHWRNGRSLPKARQMFKIKKLSHGAVSYDTMIDMHFSK